MKTTTVIGSLKYFFKLRMYSEFSCYSRSWCSRYEAATNCGRMKVCKKEKFLIFQAEQINRRAVKPYIQV